ncbi:MAG: tetratricopeptide repeat protein [Geitlerinemataceae cyanobacterium]
MSDVDIDWDEDVELDAEDEYRALVRSITWNEGFGLVFVRCSPAQGKDLIAKLRGEVSGKRMEVLELTEPIDNFYQQVEKLEHRDQIEILFVSGLEKSLYAYEDTKRVAGWTSRDIYTYDWKGVPRVLVNLNQQRERLQRDFPFCFVFLVPVFVLKYFTKRAPDFFDWKSGVFQLPESPDTLQQASLQMMAEGDYEKYRALTETERVQKILELCEWIEEENQTPETKAKLWQEVGVVYAAGELYEEAIASWDKAVEFKPDYHEAWNNRGVALGNLGRYEEAIASYDKAIETQPNDDETWYNRGYALFTLKRTEEALASYHRAIELNPNNASAWYNTACLYAMQQNLDAAISHLQKAIDLDPKYRDMAKTDTDFDCIRDCDRFLKLLDEDADG